jgi:hypothetical protein
VLVAKKIKEQNVSLSLDDSFVHNFIKHGGKFLYCQKKEDVTKNIMHISNENNWTTLSYINKDLNVFLTSLKVNANFGLNNNFPLFTTCEFLIAENGSILFSEKQFKDQKVPALSNDFIVFATTSQIVKNKGESLTGIKLKYKKNIPSNISPIKYYGGFIDDDNFLNYGANNSKNLYLLLLEDL